MGSEYGNEWVSQIASVLVCEIIQSMSGIELEPCPEQSMDYDDVDAVYGLVDGDYCLQLQFKADRALFFRLARNMIGGEPEDLAEVEEYAVEFFNVLCGRFISEVYRTTHAAARFHPTRYEEDPHVTVLRDREAVEKICFISDKGERAAFLWTTLSIEKLLRRSIHVNA